MSKIKRNKESLKSKLHVIKKINENSNKININLNDRFENKVLDYGNFTPNKLSSSKKKKENNNDIFSELIDIATIFLTKKENKYEDKKNNPFDKIMLDAIIASKTTLKKIPTIFSDETKKVFFADSQSICGTEQFLPTSNLTLSPKDFDFFNMLSINPSSINGKLLYENNIDNIGNKLNKNIFNTFETGEYLFRTNNQELFTLKWDINNQIFKIENINRNIKIDDFFDEIFSSIENIDINTIFKQAMGLTLQFDNTESNAFNESLTKFIRVVNKIFKNCNSNGDRDLIKNQTTLGLVDENDDDDNPFDFSNIDGVDFNEEDRIRGVINFVDCDNIEVPIDLLILEDFSELFDLNPNSDTIINTLNRASFDANQQINNNGFNPTISLSLIKTFINNIPKSIAMSLLTPKMILPIVLVYKSFNSDNLNIDDIFKKLSKLFTNLIKIIFWDFITEFWRLLKKDLLLFISILVAQIIQDKLKKKIKMLQPLLSLLINILTKVLNSGISNCTSLYGTIITLIEQALAGGPSFNIPGILLGASDKLPGYDANRALLNISERLESAGINLDPIYGEDNDIINLVKSIVDGHSDEMDVNSFVKVTNKKITIPSPIGPIIIPPGLLNSVGKTF